MTKGLAGSSSSDAAQPMLIFRLHVSTFLDLDSGQPATNYRSNRPVYVERDVSFFPVP